MSSHTNSSFLNSCVKVPIDPCNRCPAPTFGRPLIYYGKDKECSKRKKKCKKKSLSGEGLCDSERKSKEALQNLKSFYHSIPDYAEINHLPNEEFYNTLDRLKTACEKLATETIVIQRSPSIDSFKQRRRPCKKTKRQKSRASSTCLGPDISGIGPSEDKPLRFDSYKEFREHITRKELQKLDLCPPPKREAIKFGSYKSFREHIDHKIRFDDELKDASDHQESSICGDDCKFSKAEVKHSYSATNSKDINRNHTNKVHSCSDVNPNREHIFLDGHSKDKCYLDLHTKDIERPQRCADHHLTESIHSFSDPHCKEHPKDIGRHHRKHSDATRNYSESTTHHNYSDPHPKNYNNYKSFREDLEKMFESELEKNFLEYKHEDMKIELPVQPHKSFHIEQSDELLSVFQEEPLNTINEAEIIRRYNKYFENSLASPKLEVDKKKSLSVNDLREHVESKLTLNEEPKKKKAPECLKRSLTSCHIEKSKPKVTVEMLPSTPLKAKQSALVSPFSLLLPKKQKKRPISASPVYPVARPNLAATLRRAISKKKLQDLDNHCTFRDSITPQVDWEVRKTPAWKTLNLSESHKNILSLRLATRKAEQKRQENDYEMQMLMMKERVKSAPLLLEGPTHWGPHVGKLTHSCHKDNFVHQCPKTRAKKKRTGSGSSKQREMMPLPPPTRKTISRCSLNSTNLNDSDDLCSLDRAYL